MCAFTCRDTIAVPRYREELSKQFFQWVHPGCALPHRLSFSSQSNQQTNRSRTVCLPACASKDSHNTHLMTGNGKRNSPLKSVEETCIASPLTHPELAIKLCYLLLYSVSQLSLGTGRSFPPASIIYPFFSLLSSREKFVGACVPRLRRGTQFPYSDPDHERKNPLPRTHKTHKQVL